MNQCIEDFEKSEVREVGTCAAVFQDEQLADLRQKLANFEAAFPDLQGRWRIAEEKEAMETFKIPKAKGALVGRAGAAWPYRLITSIWASLLTSHSSSLTIESNTPAMNIRRVEANADYPYAISTPRGIVRTRHIFHCTEGHASHLIPGLRGIIVPRRGEMTVQTPGS
ncbi:FAD dependent oxidoreductase [Colletotrichum asianum]